MNPSLKAILAICVGVGIVVIFILNDGPILKNPYLEEKHKEEEAMGYETPTWYKYTAIEFIFGILAILYGIITLMSSSKSDGK